MGATLTDLYAVSLGKGAVADGTAECLSAVEDMEGFDEIDYIVQFGDVDAAAVLTFTPKENTASSTSSPTPTAVELEEEAGSLGAITSGALVITEDSGNLDNKTVIVTVGGSKIGKRYQFLSITATVESYEIVSITTVKRKARTLPVTQPSVVVAIAKGVS
jgi:hypothetical protein